MTAKKKKLAKPIPEQDKEHYGVWFCNHVFCGHGLHLLSQNCAPESKLLFLKMMFLALMVVRMALKMWAKYKRV